MSKIRYNPKTKELRRAADDLGFSYENTGTGHLKFTHPDADKPVYTSSTPRTQRGMKNAIAMLKKVLVKP